MGRRGFRSIRLLKIGLTIWIGAKEGAILLSR
jgi:hypothetical protein